MDIQTGVSEKVRQPISGYPILVVVLALLVLIFIALHLLSSKNIIELDEEKKTAMVSNLMVVLCGDKETQPIVNAGTLNH